ncbi:MAG: EAL domain-containing protein [Myxococcales bacterium]|nr:EAL domain-containing protein [Myxococcales bacterium]
MVFAAAGALVAATVAHTVFDAPLELSLAGAFALAGWGVALGLIRAGREPAHESIRVQLLLDVATIANAAETFREAGAEVARLIVRRLPVECVSVSQPLEGSTTPRVIAHAGTSQEKHNDDTRRAYPIRLGPERFGQMELAGPALDGADNELHHVFLGVAGHLAQVAMRERVTEAHLVDARSDELTGLPNRRAMHLLLEEALERASQQGRKVGLLYVDLNGFKGVNDTFGHESGDRVLRVMSRRLSRAVRLSDAILRDCEHGDRVSRIGGDEFCIILDEIRESADAEIVARRIISAATAPIPIEPHAIELGAAIGIAIYPDDAQTASELLRMADMAMYAAKSDPESACRRYSDLDEHDYSNFLLAQELRKAIEQQSLEFHLQPVFDAGTGNLVAAEALLRWSHPEKGWIPPSRFIPVAENAGLIKRLGRFVLQGAYEWLVESRDQLPEGFRISVNTSAKQLEDPDFFHEVATMVADSPLAPGQLELEVTETVVLDESPNVWEHIRALAGLGVSFALDDFGTGYSSLSMLKRFPIHRIKIDRSFVGGLPDRPDDEAIVLAILAMARSMGLPVLAEGVENEEQLDFLVSQGCAEIQGYLLGRPAPPSEILRIHEGQQG